VCEWLTAHLFYICIILCVCVFVFAPVDLFACLLTVLCIVCIAMRINILIQHSRDNYCDAALYKCVIDIVIDIIIVTIL